jgi:uncharacterized protein YacL
MMIIHFKIPYGVIAIVFGLIFAVMMLVSLNLSNLNVNAACGWLSAFICLLIAYKNYDERIPKPEETVEVK